MRLWVTHLSSAADALGRCTESDTRSGSQRYTTNPMAIAISSRTSIGEPSHSFVRTQHLAFWPPTRLLRGTLELPGLAGSAATAASSTTQRNVTSGRDLRPS